MRKREKSVPKIAFTTALCDRRRKLRDAERVNAERLQNAKVVEVCEIPFSLEVRGHVHRMSSLGGGTGEGVRLKTRRSKEDCMNFIILSVAQCGQGRWG